MVKYELTKDLVSGNAIIDREHKELFQAINKLMDACGQGKGRSAIEGTVKFLLDYVDRHFAHEEQLQKGSNYPGFAAHHMFHENYKAKLRQIANNILAHEITIADLSTFNSHVAVLVSHIRLEDKKLGAFLQKK